MDDIAGMSGGPIFGVKLVDGRLRYWVIGIQSSWVERSRVICFCPSLPFFALIKELKSAEFSPVFGRPWLAVRDPRSTSR